MFQDLVQKSKVYGKDAEAVKVRREEVKIMLKEVVESALPEINTLGFVNVEYYSLVPTSFNLRIQVRRGYSGESFTHNMSFSSTSANINYGSGANSAKGKQIGFDYNWNDSKLIGTMKDALRALVSDALKSSEYIKAQGWG